MEKKYQVTNDTIEFNGRTLHRIRALKDFDGVKKGDVGGFVESEWNLSQYGNCWIYDDAMCMDNATVKGNAKMYDNAVICSRGGILDNVKMYGKSVICDDGIAKGNSMMFGNSRIKDNAMLLEDSMMFDNSELRNHSRAYGNSKLYDNSVMCDESLMFGDGMLCGTMGLRMSVIMTDRNTVKSKKDKSYETITLPHKEEPKRKNYEIERYLRVNCNNLIVSKEDFIKKINKSRLLEEKMEDIETINKYLVETNSEYYIWKFIDSRKEDMESEVYYKIITSPFLDIDKLNKITYN